MVAAKKHVPIVKKRTFTDRPTVFHIPTSPSGLDSIALRPTGTLKG
jgi:hypothetical protein